MVKQGPSGFQRRYSLSLMFSPSTLGSIPSIHLVWLVYGKLLWLIRCLFLDPMMLISYHL